MILITEKETGREMCAPNMQNYLSVLIRRKNFFFKNNRQEENQLVRNSMNKVLSIKFIQFSMHDFSLHLILIGFSDFYGNFTS